MIGLSNGYKRAWLLVGQANARVKKLHVLELSRNQLILRFDVILQHVWPIDQCFLNTRIFFGGKTKSSCSYPIIHWLIKQITNTHRNHFSRLHKNRSNACVFLFFSINPCRCCQVIESAQKRVPEFIYLCDIRRSSI